MRGAVNLPKNVLLRLRLVRPASVPPVTAVPGRPAVRRDLVGLVHVPLVRVRLRAADQHRLRGRLLAARVRVCKHGAVATRMTAAVSAGVLVLAVLAPVRNLRRSRARSPMTAGARSSAW